MIFRLSVRGESSVLVLMLLGRFFALSCVMIAGASGWAAVPSLKVDLGQGVSLQCLPVHEGDFTQGSPAGEVDRGPDEAQRTVHMTREFYLGKTEVTRAQWERFAQETGFRTEAEKGPSGGFGWDGNALVQRKEYTWKNPGFEQSPEDPVCIIAYPDAEAFCRWLSKKSGYTVTLPTEAQWEYACRAKMTSAWHNGANTPEGADEVAWSKHNAQNHTHPVTSLKPNSWGFYIGGNVSEWCQDWYAPYEPGEVTNPLQSSPAPGDKPRRVVRGGSWAREAKNTRSAARFRLDPLSRNADTGFRVVLVVDRGAAPAVAPPAANTSANNGSFSLPREEAAQPNQPPSATGDVDGPPVMVKTQQHRSTLLRLMMLGGKGALCLACPGGIVLVLVVLMLRSQKNRPAPTPGPGGSSVPPSPWTGAGGHFTGVRVGKDGFWVRLDSVPPGSRVHYTYRRNQPGAAATDVNDTLIYEPGPEGQFVYTGVEPEAPRITGVESSGNPLSSTSTITDPGPGGFGMGSLHSHGIYSPPHSQGFSDQHSSAPPRYPSAY